MLVSKEKRKKLLDFLEKLCETSNMSKKTLGYTMRSYHVSCPFILLTLLFYCPQWVVTFHAINLIVIFGLFTLVFNGCILTMLEHRLCGDEYTIADPFIEQLDMELNSRNRMIISYCIAIGYFCFFFLVYYYRFYFNKAKSLVPATLVPAMASLVPATLVSAKLVPNIITSL